MQNREKVPVKNLIRSRPGKPNQRKGQNAKFMNFAHFCEFWCFSLGKQARFTYRTFVPESPPPRKVHELAFPWFGLPGPLLNLKATDQGLNFFGDMSGCFSNCSRFRFGIQAFGGNFILQKCHSNATCMQLLRHHFVTNLCYAIHNDSICS